MGAFRSAMRQHKNTVRIPFGDALRRTGIPIAGFIRHIQRGSILPVAIDPARTGLQKYMFDINDLEALKEDKRL